MRPSALVTPGGLERPPRDVLLYNATSSVGVLGGATFVARRQRVSRHRARRDGDRREPRVDAPDHPAAGRRHRRRERQAGQPRRCSPCAPSFRRARLPHAPAVPEGGRGQPEPARGSLALLHPVGSSTDLGLTGSYYGYDQDPTTAVFFTARANAAGGRLARGRLPPGSGPLVDEPQHVPAHRWLDAGALVPVPELRLFHRAGARRGPAHLLADDPTWTVWVSGSAQWDLLADPTSPTPDTASTTLVVSGRVALGFRAQF